MLSEHRILLKSEQFELIQSALREAQCGASSTAIQKTSGLSTDELRMLSASFMDHDPAQSLLLPTNAGRNVYDLLHAVIYGLGPIEFQTLTGASIPVALNVNLTIASKLWGVYKGAKF